MKKAMKRNLSDGRTNARAVLKGNGRCRVYVAGPIIALAVFLTTIPAFSQAPIPIPVASPAGAGTNAAPATHKLKYKGTPLEIILKDYSKETGRTPLQGPGVPNVSITLESQTNLTVQEYLDAIEAVLAMHGVGLVKSGDKFIKVVPIGQVRNEAMETKFSLPDPKISRDNDELVSQLIQLRNIDVAEATKAITPLKHAYGQIHGFERNNSVLVTDTASTVNRIIEIIGMLDQPIEALEVPNIVRIRFSKASEIKAKLEEIIADTQKDVQKSTVPRSKDTGSPGVVRTPAVPAIPGVIRPPLPTPAVPTPSIPENVAEIIEQAERGIIRGKVKIVADDRTSTLIIITRKENMKFFDQIIQVLDVATAPDIIVKVIGVEYAEAESIATTLNTLIGQVDKTKDAKAAAVVATAGAKPEDAASASLRDYIDRLERERETATRKEKSSVGELSSANIKILPDKRSNSIIVMASQADTRTVEELIKSMDIMLSQVLIESVILQVDLDDRFNSGMHWVQRSLIFSEQKNGGREAVSSVAGSAGGGAGSMAPATSYTSLDKFADLSGGLNAYFTHFGLNLDAIVKMVKTDSRSRIVATPVIVTTDNTKAKLTSSEQKYFLKGLTVVSGSDIVRPEVETRDIGLDLEVTPHINKSKNVTMEIAQSISNPGETQVIQKEEWPTTKKRSFTASIAVRDHETIVLGGLVREENRNTKTKVPFLGSLPLVGWLFSSKSVGKQRSELVVFMTPYVLDTPEEVEKEMKSRRDALHLGDSRVSGWDKRQLGNEDPIPKVRRPVQDPLAGLTPEQRKLVESSDKTYGRSLRNVDRKVDDETREQR